jgi:uncharacterized Tic20 family protein
MKTGHLIKTLRLKKGITQEELADKTDISVRTIQRIENGDVDPRAYTLQSIAAALEVDFEVLNLFEESRNDNETKKWLPILHLSGLLLTIVAPIIVWIWKKSKVENINAHAYDVINFQLSMSLYLFPCLLFSIHPFTIFFTVFSQIFIIINTVKVNNGRPYKYPLNIRFLKP